MSLLFIYIIGVLCGSVIYSAGLFWFFLSGNYTTAHKRWYETNGMTRGDTKASVIALAIFATLAAIAASVFAVPLVLGLVIAYAAVKVTNRNTVRKQFTKNLKGE